MKIALVYDRVVKFGGAERILLALNEIWPKAPLYTAIYDRKNAGWAKVFKIKVSFLNKIPFINRFQELTTLITPYAFESFNFDKFDVVVSISSQDAKCIITKPSTLHINYCLTPTRYLWSGFPDYYAEPAQGVLNPLIRFGLTVNLNRLRIWDKTSAGRPDKYIAISEEVKQRILKFYKLDSEVIYPPLNTDTFKPAKISVKGKYFLIVSRLVPYKKIDYAIRTFNLLKLPLKIIGSGIDEKRLYKLAAENIEFIRGNLTDQKLCWYYQNCACLIFPGIEDFGLTPLEAQACGKPVIAFNGGGAVESVLQDKTGILYYQKNELSLKGALKEFNNHNFDPEICRKNALNFSKIKFQDAFKSKIERYYQMYINNK